MSFKGKTVIVTGASSGIGAGAAILFAKEGANVTIIGRNEDKLKKTAEECQKHGANVLILNIDISNEDEAKTIVKQTIEKFGKLNVLVNNAGIARKAAILDENVLKVYDEVMNTNMRAVVQVTNLAAPYLVETKGSVINVSSVGSTNIPLDPGYFAYSVSKAAMDHFTRCIASELAPKGVRVNVVNPGPVKTDIAINSGMKGPIEDVFWEKMKKRTALGRVSDVEEIGELIVYLASDKARGITGSSFVTDNGMLLM